MNHWYHLKIICPVCKHEVLILKDGGWLCPNCNRKGTAITEDMVAGGEQNGGRPDENAGETRSEEKEGR